MPKLQRYCVALTEGKETYQFGHFVGTKKDIQYLILDQLKRFIRPEVKISLKVWLDKE